MTGRSDRPGREPDALELLSRVAASRVSRRQLTKLGGALALSALLPEWAVPARAAGLATMAKVTGPCPPQKKGSCDRVRVDWMPGCKTPVAKGNASEFNGCGPQSGLDLPLLGHGDWVPDEPLDLANFFDACKGHDCCYGKCGSEKSDCDADFLKGMLQACESGQGAAVTGLFGGLNLTTCYEVAGVYYAAVHDTDTGQDAFNSGQAEVCDCCESYTVQFDSKIELAPSAGSSWSGAFQYEYTAQIPLTTPADGSAHASGSAQGSYAQAAGTMTDPTGSGTLVWTLNSGIGDRIQVVDFQGGTAPTIALTISAPRENYTLTVPIVGPESFQGPFWADVFLLTENVNFSNGQITLPLTPGPGATKPGSGPVAQGEFVHSADIGTLNGGPAVALTATEHTIITVTAS